MIKINSLVLVIFNYKATAGSVLLNLNVGIRRRKVRDVLYTENVCFHIANTKKG
jgi:hypothetical protein